MERVVVIGCGSAGRFASRLLIEKGYEVIAIDNRRGSTWQFSGVVNGGWLPGVPHGEQIGMEISELFERVATYFPQHIFHGFSGKDIEGYLRKVFTTARGDNLFFPISSKTLPFLTVEGTIRTGITSWKTILPLPSSGEVVVVVPRCISDLPAERVKFFVEKSLKNSSLDLKVTLREVGLFCERGYYSILELNRILDRNPPVFEKLVDLLREYRGGNIFIPPILGVIRWKEHYEMLTDEISANVSEMVAVEESPFGLRWENECERIFDDIVKVKATVVGFKASGNRIESVTTESQNTIEGDKFILATGKFLGGGIYRDFKRAEETIFHFPLFIGDEILKPEEDIQSYFSEDFSGIHPIWFAGVRRDSAGRPVNRWGEATFENLYAVGSVVSGVDYTNSGTGISSAIFSLRGVRFLNE